MQIDKDLMIKETFSMEPRTDFVLNTELQLRKAARKMKRKRTFKLISLTSSGFILSIIAILWIISFNGKENIGNTLSSFVESKPISAVKNNEPLVYIYHSHNQESNPSDSLAIFLPGVGYTAQAPLLHFSEFRKNNTPFLQAGHRYSKKQFYPSHHNGLD